MLGLGTELDPYQVETASDLNDVRNNLSAYYEQIADIDLREYSNWIPIGDPNNPFTGIYDGGNYFIDGLTINTTIENAGLFGILNSLSATLKNINIVNANVYGYINVGALLGRADIGNVLNCFSSGVVTSNEKYFGGLIGTLGKGTVTKCGSSCNVTASISDTYCAGGLIGFCDHDSVVTESYATGDVINHHTSGGLIGRYHGKTALIKCYATGDVISNGYYIGGLVGNNSISLIFNCYAMGNVSGLQCIGGLVGASNSSPITNCYSTGLVTGSNMVGGLIGKAGNSFEGPGSITSCYYDIETSGLLDTSERDPRTTLEMKTQSTYVDWDFTNVWAISADKNNGYPNFDITKNIIIYTKSFYL